jgi:hypothetical protein
MSLFSAALSTIGNVRIHALRVLFSGSLIGAGLTLGTHLHAIDHHAQDSAQRLARHLVVHFWEKVKHQDVEGYSKQIACPFLGLNISGHYDRDDQISGLEGLTVSTFEIRNLVAERYDDSLVISYDFYAQGAGITSGPSIDVWQQEGHHWQIVSHSYVPFEET